MEELPHRIQEDKLSSPSSNGSSTNELVFRPEASPLVFSAEDDDEAEESREDNPAAAVNDEEDADSSLLTGFDAADHTTDSDVYIDDDRAGRLVLAKAYMDHPAEFELGPGQPGHKLQAKWDGMYQRLIKFKEKYGHCLVPNRYPDDPQLGAWVSIVYQIAGYL